jgi:hypothetical protein
MLATDTFLTPPTLYAHLLPGCKSLIPLTPLKKVIRGIFMRQSHLVRHNTVAFGRERDKKV